MDKGKEPASKMTKRELMSISALEVILTKYYDFKNARVNAPVFAHDAAMMADALLLELSKEEPK